MTNELQIRSAMMFWIRHASITTKQLEKSERRSLKRLGRYMKRSAELSHQVFPITIDHRYCSYTSAHNVTYTYRKPGI